MASTFPTALDVIPDAPVAPALGGSTPTHPELHDLLRDAIAALEATVGTDAAAKLARLLGVLGGQTLIGGTPVIRFDEERRVLLSDGTSMGFPEGAIQKEFTNPSATFPLLNPETGEAVGSTLSHGEVYAVLWSLYMALAAERDAAIVEEPPPGDFRDRFGAD